MIANSRTGRASTGPARRSTPRCRQHDWRPECGPSPGCPRRPARRTARAGLVVADHLQVLAVQQRHPTLQALDQAGRIHAAERRPIDVDFQRQARLVDQHVEHRAAVGAEAQELVRVMVVAQPNAVFAEDLRHQRRLTGERVVAGGLETVELVDEGGNADDGAVELLQPLDHCRVSSRISRHRACAPTHVRPASSSMRLSSRAEIAGSGPSISGTPAASTPR